MTRVVPDEYEDTELDTGAVPDETEKVELNVIVGAVPEECVLECSRLRLDELNGAVPDDELGELTGPV